ncbi:NAD(P)-dependent alcohol dehydrogenase [Streptomyces sp. NPDC005917]|uniref:zinc-dependent alcohol dehydrogenase family protein n=1 Tax=unclassified Streptomyces TaxID=2593676 RepID=UPI0033C58F66
MNTPTGSLDLIEEPKPAPGTGQVLVRVEANSLNARDQMILGDPDGAGATSHARIPLSDGAGVVEAVGDAVTRFEPGARVAGSFHPTWFGGPRRARGPAYGVGLDGWLTEYVVIDQQALVAVPDHLTIEEAATLPCAAVTAWSAIKGVGPGDTVLVQGTGGVSLFATQLARVCGARVIATTSNPDNTARLQDLGVSDVINYRESPRWGADVVAVTAGRGVDRIVEVGGPGTLAESVAALAYGGRISLVGHLSKTNGALEPMALFSKGGAITSIAVGSRSDFEDMNRVLAQHEIRPLISAVFDFEKAGDAFAHFSRGPRFGKVVIRHRTGPRS